MAHAIKHYLVINTSSGRRAFQLAANDLLRRWREPLAQ